MSQAYGFDDSREEVVQLISSWRHGQSVPNTRLALEERPHLASDREAVIDLACEEFLLRRQAGEDLAASTFCGQFPTYRKSLMKLLEFEAWVDENETKVQRAATWEEAQALCWDLELVRELGRGGFARVYLAREVTVGQRLVAVKLTPYDTAEPHTLGKLAHPAIVRVLSVQEDSGLFGVRMAYEGSATLNDVLELLWHDRSQAPQHAQAIIQAASDRTAVPEENSGSELDAVFQNGRFDQGVAEIGRQLAEGLSYAHRQGVIHRDLKPTNVIVNRSGRALLLDFNLSFDHEFGLERIGGTLPYMPPEQIQQVFLSGNQINRSVDLRSDIFALGTMLYELLTGRLPYGDLDRRSFSRNDASLRLEEMQSRPLQPIRQLNPQVAPTLAKIVERCLALDAGDRPASAAELAEELKDFLSPRVQKQRWLADRVPQLVAVGLVATLLLMLLVPARRSHHVHLAKGQMDAAIRQLDRELAANPVFPDQLIFWRLMATALDGRYLEAVDFVGNHYQRDLPEAYRAEMLGVLSYCRLMTNQYRGAWAEGQLATRSGFDHAIIRGNNALAMVQGGFPLQALAEVQHAIDNDNSLRNDNSLPFTRLVRAFVVTRIERPTDEQLAVAIEDLEYCIEQGDQRAELLLVLARLGIRAQRDRRFVESYVEKAFAAGATVAQLDSFLVPREFAPSHADPTGDGRVWSFEVKPVNPAILLTSASIGL